MEVAPMREVDLATFVAAHRDGAAVIDVRQPYEYLAGHVPGARLLPLDRLPAHAAELPRTAPVYVICAHGHRSLVAADFLARAGVDAWSVAGGTSAWVGAGHRVVRGGPPAA
jgi:rhodanese-related sulfurtransferase